MQFKCRANKISGNGNDVTNASPTSCWSKAKAVGEQVQHSSFFATSEADHNPTLAYYP